MLKRKAQAFIKQKRKYIILASTLLILAAVPLTVFLTIQIRDNRSKAAGPVSSEAESATLSGAVTTGTDTNASGGSFIQFGATVPPTTFQPTAPYYATFFYPWYGTATDRYNQWNDLSHSPPSNWFSNYLPDMNPASFDPTNELYRSTDDATLYWQLNKLKEAKQEVAISSWWGQGHKTDTAFNKIITDIMNRANNPYPNLRWAIYYEKEGNVINGTSDPTVADIQSDLTYIKTKYATQPGMLKINGKPVIFVYGDAADGAGMASRWAQANSAKDFYVVLKVYPGYATDPNQPDSWHQYSPAVRTDNQGAYSYSVSPGFWLSGATVRLARDLTAFRSGVSSMLASSAKWKLTETWNEWGEGSSVEPGDEVFQVASGNATLNPSGAPFKNQYIDALNQLLPALESSCTTNCDTIAPSATITAPTAGASVQGTINVIGSATDNVGVTKVEFYVDGALKSSVTTGTFNFSWNSTSVANRSYTLSVKAYDAAGNGPGMANVNINVNNPDTVNPAVTISSPAPNSTVSGNMTLSGTATDNIGVVKVEYYIDSATTAAGSATTSGTSTPFSFTVNTSALSGLHSFKVIAYDAASNQSLPTTVSVTVQIADTTAPSVPTGLTANLASATSNQVNLSWNASTDNVGGSGLKSYLVTRNSVVIATVTAPTTTYPDTATNYNTAYSYTVSATDNAGNTSVASTAASITTPNVPDTTAPTVPSGVGASVASPTQVNVSWNASSDSGTGVAGYRVYRDGTQIGTTAANSLSYGDVFSFVKDQSYSYTVAAFDAASPANVSAKSSPSSVTPNPTIVSSGACGFKTTPPATYNHVIVLIFENKTYTNVIGSSSAPYINSLVAQCGTSSPATSAKNGWHDANYKVNGTTDGSYVSKPSYATLTSGVPPTVHGLNNDSYSTTSGVENIYHQLYLAGISFKDYYSGSASTTPCASSNFSGAYHDAIRYYTNLGGQSSSTSTICNTHDLPLSTFMTDVNNGTLPAFSMILPTNSENMHDNSISSGDTWAQNFLTPLLSSAQYKSGDTAIFFLWDEDTPIPNILIAPTIVPGSKGPVQTGNPISHFSALRTIEEMLGLPFIGDVSSAPSLRGPFNW